MMNAIRKNMARHGDLIPIYSILLVMIVVMAIFQPNFFSFGNFSLLCRQLSPYIFIAISQAVIMIIGGMDFSVGAMVSLSTCIFATNLNHGTWNIPVLVAIVLICGTIGALTGLLISWFKLPSIVVTLATSFILVGGALLFLPTPGGAVPPDIAGWLTGDIGFVPVPLIIMALLIALWAYIRRSSIGLLLFAVGANKEAARISGLSVHKAFIVAYFLGSVMSSMAGLMLSAITMSGDPSIGTPMTINSVTAAVLGGVSFSGGQGKIVGAVAGAIVVGMLVNILFYLRVTGFYTYVVQGVILILAVAANSRSNRVVLK
jgi:ribose transport system permease protein